MKNFIFGLTFIFTIILTACNTQFGMIYDVTLTGNGDGNFEVTFPQGSYSMNGAADFALVVGDTIPFNNVVTKETILANNNKKQINALKKVNNYVADEFEAFSGEGTYDLWIKGYVKEMGTGLVFEVDRHITNKEVTKSASNDPYPFVK